MGTVLILSPAEIKKHPAVIRESHINLWILSAFLGKRYLLDLGFFLKNEHQKTAINSIQVLVPLPDPEAKCLVSHMTDVAEASWGVVFAGYQPAADVRMRCRELRRKSIKELQTHSYWEIGFDGEVGAGQERYVRIRFASYERPECLDSSGGWFGLGARLRLDLRLFDYREHAEFRGLGEDLRTKLIPIKRSHVYFVAPHVNRPELFSPNFSYIRILEDRLWERYLWRTTSWPNNRHRKMLVYCWRQGTQDDQAISSHRIFATLIPRGFLSNANRLFSVVVGAIGVIFLSLAVLQPLITLQPFQPSTTSTNLLSRVPLYSLILVIILNLPRVIEQVSKWFKWGRRLRRTIDEKLYVLRN